MEDLFNLAEANTSSIIAAYDVLCDGLAGDPLAAAQEFVRRVRADGAISMNVRGLVLLRLLTRNEHLNIHEWAKVMAPFSSKDEDTLISEKLKDYYPKRVAFDGTFLDGVSFRYGALSIGGLGSAHYGPYCVVMDHGMMLSQGRVAFLKNDSLKEYVTREIAVLTERITEDSSGDEGKGCLAALKLSELYPPFPPDNWESLLCNDSDYVEAIFTAKPTSESIKAIRIGADDYTTYYDYAFESVGGRLPEPERILVETFSQIVREARDLNILVEAVDA